MLGKAKFRVIYSKMMNILALSKYFRCFKLLFLSFLLFLPISFAQAQVQNTTGDNQHSANEASTDQNGANQSPTVPPASPQANSVEPNSAGSESSDTTNNSDAATKADETQNATIQQDKPSAENELEEQSRCQKDAATWKSCVQLKLKRFGSMERNHEETEGGLVTIRFGYNEEGKITNIVVSKSSGDEKLDQRAVALLERIATIPKPIKGGGMLTVPIHFTKVEKKQSEDETLNDKATTDPSSQN